MSRIFQHEMDHLNGLTMFDRSTTLRENELYKPYLQRRKKERLKLETKAKEEYP